MMYDRPSSYWTLDRDSYLETPAANPPPVFQAANPGVPVPVSPAYATQETVLPIMQMLRAREVGYNYPQRFPGV